MGLFGKKKAKVREAEADVVAEAEAAKAVGPYDEADAPEDDELLECGALRLPPVETIQFTVERSREVVLGAVYIVGESALQLQVFAAPKSSGLWDDVRADMISSIASQGGSSREAEGDYGQEIHAQMPVEGSRTVNPVRYLGIDGPRWLLRAPPIRRATFFRSRCRVRAASIPSLSATGFRFRAGGRKSRRSAEVSPRRVEVTGEITSIAYPGAGNSPVLRARIKAPEGEFVLAFLGRTIVRCIEVGSRLTVRGAVSGRDAVPTIFDPAYTVLPGE